MSWTEKLGWQEAVLSVTDLDRWIDDLHALGGWTVRHRGMVHRSLLDYWDLPASVTAEEVVLFAPEEDHRWLRLIRFEGAPQLAIRASAQPWDTGGLFSLLIRTDDIESVYQTALQRGWGSHNEVDVMRFEDIVTLNVVLRGPDGINFGVYEFVSGGEDGRPPMTRFGMPFTSQQIVRSVEASRAFYADSLGWSATYNGETRLAINQFGMPDNYKGWVPKYVSLIEAVPQQWGQLELVQWTIFQGRDVSSLAKPPNIGPTALRWCVPDLEKYLPNQDTKISSVVFEPSTVKLEPFGEVSMLTIRSPDGALIEIVETP